MKCSTLTALTATGLVSVVASAQTVIAIEDFEDNTVLYTTNTPEFSDGGSDYFIRTNGSDISGANVYNNPGGSFFFAVNDADGEGATLPVIQTFTVDVSGFTDLGFSVLLAEDDDGSNQDYDAADSVVFEYQIDGGGFSPIFIVAPAEASGSNFEPLVDGTPVTDTFSEFSSDLTGSGSTLEIRVSYSLNSGDEDLAIDDVTITGVIPEPASLALVGLGTLGLASGRRRNG